MKKKVALLLSLCLSITPLAAESVLAQEEVINPTEITWVYTSNEEGGQQQVEWIAENFRKKYPQITLNVERLPSDQGRQLLSTKIASDDAPQIFYISGRADYREFNNAGYLYDLTGQPFLENLNADVLADGQVDGKQLVVVASTDALGITYNKDLFEEYDLKVPTTYSELTALCDRLLELGITPFATGFKSAWTAEAFFMDFAEIQCSGTDSEWYNKKMNLETTFSEDEAFKDAYEHFWNLKKYFTDDFVGTEWNDALELMATGKAAMVGGGNWAFDGVLSKNPDMHIGMFATPISEDPADTKIVVTPAGGNVLFNSDDPDKIKAGLLLMEEMYTDEAINHGIELTKQYSTGKHITAELPAAWGDVNAYINDGMSFSRSGIDTFTAEYINILRTNIISYLMEETLDIDAFAAQMDADFAAAK